MKKTVKDPQRPVEMYILFLCLPVNNVYIIYKVYLWFIAFSFTCTFSFPFEYFDLLFSLFVCLLLLDF